MSTDNASSAATSTQQQQEHQQNEVYSTEELLRNPQKAAAYAKRLERELLEERAQNKCLNEQLLKTNIKLQLDCDLEEEVLTQKLQAKLESIREEQKRIEAAIQQELDARDPSTLLTQFNDAIDKLEKSSSVGAAEVEALRAVGLRFAQHNAQLRQELDKQFLQLQKTQRELEKQKEQSLVQRKVEMDDEMLMERAWNVGARKRSSSSASADSNGHSGYTSDGNIGIEMSPVGCSPRSASTKRRSGSVFMQKAEAAAAAPALAAARGNASPSTAPMPSAFLATAEAVVSPTYEPSPLQQLLQSNYVEPISPRRATPRDSPISSPRSSPVASVQNLGINVPGRRFSGASASSLSPRLGSLQSTSAPQQSNMNTYLAGHQRDVQQQ